METFTISILIILPLNHVYLEQISILNSLSINISFLLDFNGLWIVVILTFIIFYITIIICYYYYYYYIILPLLYVIKFIKNKKKNFICLTKIQILASSWR